MRKVAHESRKLKYARPFIGQYVDILRGKYRAYYSLIRLHYYTTFPFCCQYIKKILLIFVKVLQFSHLRDIIYMLKC